MVFVILGSQKFQFNRLLQKVDELAGDGTITESVFAQTGYSDYKPQNYKFTPFLSQDEFIKAEERAEIVITHGGTGAIIGAVKKGKKVIAVPRLAKYGEHVDDHQIQLLRQFEEMKIIECCYELSYLAEIYSNIRSQSFYQYHSNVQKYIDDINVFLQSNFEM